MFATRSAVALIWQRHKNGLPQLDEEQEVTARAMADHPEYWPEWDQNVEFNLPDEAGRPANGGDTPPVLSDFRFDPEKGEVNPYLHIVIHSVVERQLSMGLPAVRRTYERLRGGGHDEHAIRHLIGRALSEEMWRALKDKVPFDEAHYERALDAL